MMQHFLLFVLCITPIYGGVLLKLPVLQDNWKKNERVFGGIDADIKEAPYQAALFIELLNIIQQVSTGVIISSNVIATNSFYNIQIPVCVMRARVGSTYNDEGGQVLEVSKYITHPNFSTMTIDYDLTLLVLSSSIIFNDVTVKSIPLPNQDTFIPDNTFGLMTGWGTDDIETTETYKVLQKIVLPVINQDYCRSLHDDFYNVTERMICTGYMKTGGPAPCVFDYGSPFVIDGTLIGIFSWGGGCGQSDNPIVFSRIPYFRNWIDQELGRL